LSVNGEAKVCINGEQLENMTFFLKISMNTSGFNYFYCGV